MAGVVTKRNNNYNKGMIVINCMNIPKYTLIGYISLSNGGWRKIIYIYDYMSLYYTILN